MRRIWSLIGGSGQIFVVWPLIASLRKFTWTKEWLCVAVLAGSQVLAMSVLGGATLDRYLLPTLPLLMIAAVSAVQSWQRRLWWLAGALLGLAISGWFYPPHPFEFENHRALLGFVEMQKETAQYLETEHPGAVVATAWPLSDSLRRPKLGYVEAPFTTKKLPNQKRATLQSFDWATADVLVVYPLVWEEGILQWKSMRRFLAEAYDYEGKPGPEVVERLTGLTKEAEIGRGAWRAMIFTRSKYP